MDSAARRPLSQALFTIHLGSYATLDQKMMDSQIILYGDVSFDVTVHVT